jgi:hypothetical protein
MLPMKKSQFIRFNRHRKVRQTLDTYSTAVASVPALAKLVLHYGQQLALLEDIGPKNIVSSRDAKLDKNTAGTVLITRLVKVANALYLLYKSEGNLEEATRMYRSPTDYRNMSELALATEAIDLSQRTTARVKELVDYNVSAADVETLTTDAASLNHLLESSRLASDAGRIKGATAISVLSDLNRFLKDDLRSGIELLKDTHEDAYKALREASQANDKGSLKKKTGTKAAKGLMLTEADAEAAAKKANRRVPLVAGAGDVYILFALDTDGNWQSSADPQVKLAYHTASAQRAERLGSEADLRNDGTTWVITIIADPDKTVAYASALPVPNQDELAAVMLVQAASKADALANLGTLLYGFPLNGTIKAGGNNYIGRGDITFV